MNWSWGTVQIHEVRFFLLGPLVQVVVVETSIIGCPTPKVQTFVQNEWLA